MQEIKDSYQSIQSPSEGEYKEKGSKFLAYAYPTLSIEEVEYYLEEVKSLHPKARHHCYAYRIGIDGEPFRANDDGEPSGTAGKPILGQLKSYEVSDVCVIVVRYFGGTKLGASGLIHAYKESASQALSSADIITKIIAFTYRLTFDYDEMGHIMNVVKNLGLTITNKVFEAQPYIDIEIRKSIASQALRKLKANLLKISEEQVNEDTKVSFCTIESI